MDKLEEFLACFKAFYGKWSGYQLIETADFDDLMKDLYALHDKYLLLECYGVMNDIRRNQ